MKVSYKCKHSFLRHTCLRLMSYKCWLVTGKVKQHQNSVVKQSHLLQKVTVVHSTKWGMKRTGECPKNNKTTTCEQHSKPGVYHYVKSNMSVHQWKNMPWSIPNQMPQTWALTTILKVAQQSVCQLRNKNCSSTCKWFSKS